MTTTPDPNPSMVDRGTDARVTFMTLPSEVRNKIYSLALVHDQPLRICRHARKNVAKGWVACKTPSQLVHESVLSCTTSVARQTRKVPVKQVFAVGLLRVTKAINAEAYAVLLRENHFSFDKTLALQVFCFTLGAKAKSLAHVEVKDMSLTLAHEHICVLSRVEEPKTIILAPAMLGFAWDPFATWDLVKPIVWRMEQPLKVGMSVRPVVSKDIQRRRLDALKFDVSKSEVLFLGKLAFEEIRGQTEREARFKALVEECWQGDANATGVRRVREEDALLTEEQAMKRVKRA